MLNPFLVMCRGPVLLLRHHFVATLIFADGTPIKSHEILMFVRLQKDAKQYCGVTMHHFSHFVGLTELRGALLHWRQA